MTTAELIEILSEYPDNTPVFDAKGFDLRSTHIKETTFDDWDNATKTADGEVPAVGVGVAIGRR